MQYKVGDIVRIHVKRSPYYDCIFQVYEIEDTRVFMQNEDHPSLNFSLDRVFKGERPEILVFSDLEKILHGFKLTNNKESEK